MWSVVLCRSVFQTIEVRLQIFLSGSFPSSDMTDFWHGKSCSWCAYWDRSPKGWSKSSGHTPSFPRPFLQKFPWKRPLLTPPCPSLGCSPKRRPANGGALGQCSDFSTWPPPTHCVRDPLKIPVLICPASSPSPAAPTKKYGALMTVDETASGRSIQPALGFTTFRTLLTPLACKGCQLCLRSMKTNLGKCIATCMIMSKPAGPHLAKELRWDCWQSAGSQSNLESSEPISWRYLQHTSMSSGALVV